MDFTPYTGLFIPAAVLACAAVAKVTGDLAAQSEAKQNSRVGRIERAVSRVAGGIATELLSAKAAGTPAEALASMRGAAVQAGAGYLATAMPDTLKAAGGTVGTLATMLHGEVSRQQLVAAAPELLTAGAALLLPSAAPAAAPDPSPAAAPAAS